MSSTPSPSKRPRLPTGSTVPSATASPFPSTRPNGPRSVGPTGTSASGGPAPIVGLGMSPVDAFSPAPADAYGMSGFTPYSTTSPAYTSGTAGITAASPISAALAHGTRILSNIQVGSPFYNATPMMQQQPYMSRYPNSQPNFGMNPMMQPNNLVQPLQQQTKPAIPQQGSPEYLKLALQHLQNTLLERLESDAEAFFDAADSAIDVTSDTRTVANKATAFKAALDNVLTYLEKNGLASIPLLPLPHTTSTPDAKLDAEKLATGSGTIADAESKLNEGDAAKTKDQDKAGTTQEAPSLQHELDSLQHLAKELFDRRQRLKESASIVTGILDS